MNHRKIMEQEFIKRAGYKPTDEELDKFISNNNDLFFSKSENTTAKKTFHADSMLLIIWFFSSIFSLIYFSAIEKVVPLLLIVGHYFLMFGIMVLLAANKYSKDSSFMFILGLAFIAYLVFFPDGIKFNISDDQLLMIVLGSVFFCGGILMIFLDKREDKMIENYIPVQAIVCGYKNLKRNKACIFEYEYNGKKYSAVESFYTNIKVLPIGSTKEIKINPEFPEKIDSNRPFVEILTNLFNWVFIIVGLILIVSSFIIF